MKGFYLLLFSCFCLVQTGFSQSVISGTVVDENDNLKLQNATVMLLQAKDSLLVSYGRTNAVGQFELKKPTNGDYLLIVSFPKYADFYQRLNNGEATTLGAIKLQSVAHLIEEVIVKRRAAITIKGDTTEYDAAQFTVEKNAKVEDLLKVLPGISVDASGKITAQGKVVKKVLVDGEEFFGDDPTLVTRNLRSDMVDKVQVYEKKSEQAERTGVDDGERQQTINVKLKDGAKNGVFGKGLAGGGTDKYYMGQLMFNRFKGSQKLSAYGLFGNNGTTTLSWQDAEKYGGDSGVSFSDDGIDVSSNNDPFSGRGVVGIPRAINTGVNYNDKWKEDKMKLNLSYKFGQINSDGKDQTERSGVINDNNVKIQDTKNQQHRANIRYDLDLDSLNLFTIRANATKKKLWNHTDNSSESFATDGSTLIKSAGWEENDDRVNNYNADLLYTRRFLKKGRSLTLNGIVGRDELTGTGFLFIDRKNIALSKDTVTDQRKEKDQQLTRLRGAITYTEPLSDKFNLSLGYSLENSKNSSLIQSFNKVGNSYSDLDEKFSSNFDFNRVSSNYRIGLNYNTEKFRASLTNNLNDDKLKQINKYDSRELERSFFTYNPRLSLNFNPAKNKRINLNYSGTNNLPSLTQIQPILNNSDQLNFYEGNENLNPSFTNSFNLFFVKFNVLSGSYTYIGGNASLTKDPISQNITNSGGVNTYKWDNISGKTDFNASGYGGTNFKLLKDLNISNEPGLSVSYSANNNFFNGERNEIKSTSYNFTYKVMRETKTGFNFNMSFSPQYRKMTSILSPDQNNSGFVFTSDGSLDYYITKTFKVYTNINYSYEAPTQAFDQKIERFLVTPGVSKKLLKDESLTVDFMVNDIFNNNIGYSRSQYNAIFTQRRYDTIRRYYMLKVSWDFNKMFVK